MPLLLLLVLPVLPGTRMNVGEGAGGADGAGGDGGQPRIVHSAPNGAFGHPQILHATLGTWLVPQKPVGPAKAGGTALTNNTPEIRNCFNITVPVLY